MRSISVPILDLVSKKAVEEFIRYSNIAVEEDGADIIIIGCTGLSTSFPELRRRVPVPVIDLVAAAIGFVRSLAAEKRFHG